MTLQIAKSPQILSEFERVVAVEIGRAHRYGRKLAASLLVFQFDTSAHASKTVDRLFTEIRYECRIQLRGSDFFSRISAGEFAIGLPETDHRGAGVVIARVINSEGFLAALDRAGGSIRKFQWGAADLASSDRGADDLLARARRATR